MAIGHIPQIVDRDQIHGFLNIISDDYPYRYAQAKDDYPYRYAQAKARSPESIRQEEIDALKVRECPLSRRRHATL